MPKYPIRAREVEAANPGSIAREEEKFEHYLRVYKAVEKDTLAVVRLLECGVEMFERLSKDAQESVAFLREHLEVYANGIENEAHLNYERGVEAIVFQQHPKDTEVTKVYQPKYLCLWQFDCHSSSDLSPDPTTGLVYKLQLENAQGEFVFNEFSGLTENGYLVVQQPLIPFTYKAFEVEDPCVWKDLNIAPYKPRPVFDTSLKQGVTLINSAPYIVSDLKNSNVHISPEGKLEVFDTLIEPLPECEYTNSKVTEAFATLQTPVEALPGWDDASASAAEQLEL